MAFLRDTAFGNLVRFVTRGRLRHFQFCDEQNPGIWGRFDVKPTTTGTRASRFEELEKEKVKEYDESIEERSGSISYGRGTTSSDSSRTVVAPQEDEYNEANNLPPRVDPEKGRNIHLIDFLPNDPENPQNWSLGKKVFVTGQICVLTTGIYIGSAIYTAGLTDIMRVFDVSQTVALLGLTLFVAGYGVGPMIWSPMSEVPQVGRNPVYIGTLFVFVLLQIPTAKSTSIGMLLGLRFLTGFFGSPVLATGGATLADIWSPKKRAYAICIWGVAAVIGPTAGPIVGGFAVMAKGWTWAIWELAWYSAFAFVLLFFLLPETSSTNILYRRTCRLRKATGNKKLICPPELMAESMTGKDIVMMTFIRPFTLNFTEPMVFLLNLYIALIYGLLYIWFESFPIVFVEIYGFSLGFLGLAFLGILLGSLVIIPPFFYYLHKYVEPQFDQNGDIQPEKRLPPAVLGGLSISICLFWFGWTSRPEVHWIVPIIGSSMFSIGSFLLFNSVLNYLPDAYPAYAASVLAGNDLFRSSFGAGFPLFVNAMYAELGVPWATSLLGFLSVAFIPIPFVLYKVGESLRKNHSRHARKDI